MARHYFSELENKAWVDYSYWVDRNTVYFTVEDIADDNDATTIDPNLYIVGYNGDLVLHDGHNYCYSRIGEEVSFTGSGGSITISGEVGFHCWSFEDVSDGASSPTEIRQAYFSVSIDLDNFFVESNDSVFTENGYSRSGSPQYLIYVDGTSSLYTTSSFCIDTYNLSDCTLSVGDTWLTDSDGNEVEATTVGFSVESITYVDTDTTRTATITWVYNASDGGEVGSGPLHGIITFDGDDESIRPSQVTATHWSTGREVETVSFDVTGSSFEYTYGTSIYDGDDKLEFHEISGYELTTEPTNNEYCNEKNVTYTYMGGYKVTVKVEEGQLSNESSPPTYITVNLYNTADGGTIPVEINGSFDGTYWTGETTLTRDASDSLEVGDVTSDDMSFVSYYIESDDSSNNTIYVGISGMISKTAADEEQEEEKQTVTVTISGTSGNNEIVVEDRDGTQHFFTSNGTHAYEGLGVSSVSSAYDFDLGQFAVVDITDPFNITITFDSGESGQIYTVNVNINFTSFDFSEYVISYHMTGIINDYYCVDDIFYPTSDYSNSFSNVELSSDYVLNISGYPKELTPVINKTVEDSTITYDITWSDGSTPSEPSEPSDPTDENTTYIYTGGTWCATATYLYTNGAWREVTPNIL